VVISAAETVAFGCIAAAVDEDEDEDAKMVTPVEDDDEDTVGCVVFWLHAGPVRPVVQL
jgi:hypothetical protein